MKNYRFRAVIRWAGTNKNPRANGDFCVVPARCSTLKQELYYAIQNLLAKG